jgi:hypothetical protein
MLTLPKSPRRNWTILPISLKNTTLIKTSFSMCRSLKHREPFVSTFLLLKLDCVSLPIKDDIWKHLDCFLPADELNNVSLGHHQLAQALEDLLHQSVTEKKHKPFTYLLNSYLCLLSNNVCKIIAGNEPKISVSQKLYLSVVSANCAQRVINV